MYSVKQFQPLSLVFQLIRLADSFHIHLTSLDANFSHHHQLISFYAVLPTVMESICKLMDI